MDTEHLLTSFQRHFGSEPELIVRSPGRVNLIGEHTDYNDGWVFPMALNLGTLVAARSRSDGILRTVAVRVSSEDEAKLDNLLSVEGVPEWARYVRGVAALLRNGGHPLMGADLLITGDLPMGAGLSSSASLELGVARALLELTGVSFSTRGLARLGQRVENEVIGVHSGIMDQLAVACGVAGYALLIDCRILSVMPVAIPHDMRVLLLDSGTPRTLAGSAYNQRRAECEQALRKLRQSKPDLQALRDVTPEILAAEAHRLDPVELRRARHVVGENERVVASAEALRQGNTHEFGRQIVRSHQSLRDDYEVSGPELDMLVELALETDGVLGARLTGAGFGGCVVALAEQRHADAAVEQIAARYRARSGRPGRGYITVPSNGVCML